MNNIEPSDFLTVKETADILKTSENTLYTYLCAKGKKPRNKFPSEIYIRVGRKILFVKPRLMEWLLSGAKMEKSQIA